MRVLQARPAGAAAVSSRPGVLGAAAPRPRARPASTRLHAAQPTEAPNGTSPDGEEQPAPLSLSMDAFNAPPFDPLASPTASFDVVLEKELLENGPRSTRRTKIVCTIGPASESEEALIRLAEGGMNVARLNFCHGTHEWHSAVIQRIRKINKERGYCIAIMVDTEGSEVHTMPLPEPLKLVEGQKYSFTVRRVYGDEPGVIGVSYDAFTDDVRVGDAVIVDGGMARLEVVNIAGPDVECVCIDPGLILSRANLTFRNPEGFIVRGRNSMLPVISSKDWIDIDFAIRERVDFIAVSFVKSSDIINNLKSYIATRCHENQRIEVIAKIESYDSVPNIRQIIDVSDGIMVARGDLGAQIPYEDVPSVQKEIVFRCRQRGKPVIVASQLLNSMIEFPIPTRAETADVADVIRQKADAIMMSGETAMGKHPEKVMSTLREICIEVEDWCRNETYGQVALSQISETIDGAISEQLCQSAADTAERLGAVAILAFTRRGQMADLIARNRPDCPIICLTDAADVHNRLALRWGVMPFLVEFQDNPEQNIDRTFALLKQRTLLKSGDLVVVVSDIRIPNQKRGVRSVQVRYVD